MSRGWAGPVDWSGEPGEPGVWPFTRGIHPTMYQGRLWTMRQYAGFGTAPETNARFHALLGAGQTGLSTAFDLPTQMGYDSDHPMAEGEVGRVGVAIDTVDDLHQLFRGIPLDQVTTSMTINATAAILLAMYVVVGEETGVAHHRLGGERRGEARARPRPRPAGAELLPRRRARLRRRRQSAGARALCVRSSARPRALPRAARLPSLDDPVLRPPACLDARHPRHPGSGIYVGLDTLSCTLYIYSIQCHVRFPSPSI